jgi:DNA-binding HxlR family transcriptional regulator
MDMVPKYSAAQGGTILLPRHIDVTVTDPVGAHVCCKAVAPVLARIGDKWSILVVMILSAEPRRFNELKRLVDGISQRMLTITLRNLERDGLVSRTMFPTIPPRVDYALTPLGHSLRVPVMALGGWVSENLPAIEAARNLFDNQDA